MYLFSEKRELSPLSKNREQRNLFKNLDLRDKSSEQAPPLHFQENAVMRSPDYLLLYLFIKDNVKDTSVDNPPFERNVACP